MQHLQLRGKVYYIRFSINNNLQSYFNNKQTYIKSLGVKNKKDATIISKYLIAKYNYIQKSTMLLTSIQIKKYIQEFRNINYQDIINRNYYLGLEQINKDIEILSTKDINHNSAILKDEVSDLAFMLNKKDLEPLIDLDTHNIDILVTGIKKIKLEILIDLQKSISQKIISTNQNNTISPTLSEASTDNYTTVDDAIDEFLNSRKDNISKKSFTQSNRDIQIFKEFCKIDNLVYINTLKHKDLIKFKNYLKKIKVSIKVSTLNNILTNIITFINYCHEQAHYIQYKITKNVFESIPIKDKLNSVRPWKDEDIKNIFNNIKIITHTASNIPKEYINEYPMIIKIAMYTGAREDEIIQLTKEDISIENDIYYIDINTNLGKNIKNISSIRKVPIHKDLEKELLAYIATKRKYLFKIKTANFAKQFSDFKTKLGYPKTVLVFHSFRHSLQNKLKQQKVQNMIINELTGHTQYQGAKMTDIYTNKYDLLILKEELDKIKYNL